MNSKEITVLPLGQVNEHKIRIIAFWVLISVTLYLLTRWAFIPFLLVADFGLRAFDQGRFSPFARISETAVKLLKLGIKPIFYPPKRFAARIGLGFSLIILVFHFLGDNSVLLVGGVLAFFAALESLAGICAGCYLYNWLMPVWHKFKPET